MNKKINFEKKPKKKNNFQNQDENNKKYEFLMVYTIIFWIVNHVVIEIFIISHCFKGGRSPPRCTQNIVLKNLVKLFN